MSATCPFDPLIVARRARRDSAMALVVRCRTAVEARAAECAQVKARLDATECERVLCRARLASLAADGAAPVELGRADERSGLLAARADEARAELMAAERSLEAARNEMSDALAAFFRAEARLDALARQRVEWLRQRAQRRDRIEEAMTDDLVVHRAVNGR
ncbi:MAG TPA: hypothetical protein VIZ64_08290 [Dokdonella sp.]